MMAVFSAVNAIAAGILNGTSALSGISSLVTGAGWLAAGELSVVAFIVMLLGDAPFAALLAVLAAVGLAAGAIYEYVSCVKS